MKSKPKPIYPPIMLVFSQRESCVNGFSFHQILCSRSLPSAILVLWIFGIRCGIAGDILNSISFVYPIFFFFIVTQKSSV